MDREGRFLGTYNGGKFWVTDPRIEDVEIEGIIHALAHNCRFNGHTDFFWSVAQHSLLVANILMVEDLLPVEQRSIASLVGLLHDVSEGLCSDISSPFKHLLTQYLVMEESVQNTMFAACGINYNKVDNAVKVAVKEADLISLSVESKLLMNPCEEWAKFGNFDDPRVDKWEKDIKLENPQIVQGKFLLKLYELLEMNNLINDVKIFSNIGIDWVNDVGAIPIFDKGKAICYIKEADKKYYLISATKKFEKRALIPKVTVDNAQSIMYILSQEDIA